MKDEYREETNLDVYSETSKGSYTDEYVKWLEQKLQSLQSCVSSCSCNDLIDIDYKIKKCIDCGKTFHFE